MIPRLKGVTAHSHDTKLPGEDGKDVAKVGGPNLRRNPSKKISETLRPIVGGTYLTLGKIPLQLVVGGIETTPRRIPLGFKSRVGTIITIIDLERGDKSNLLSYPLWQSRPVEHQGDSPERSPTFVDVRGKTDQERCIPIPRWTGIKPEALETWRIDISMGVGVQLKGDSLVAICTRYSGDDLDIKAIHPS